MKICVLCITPLTEENDSVEHVIPNAIGGRLKLKGFICKPCNSKTGHSWDAVTSQQLAWFINYFDVQRDRDENSPSPAIVQTAGGLSLRMHQGGKLSLVKPTVVQTPQENGTTQLQIVARDEREARGILTGLSAKYRSIDVEALMANVSITTSYPGAVRADHSFGGPQSGRSMVKSVLALAVHAGIPMETCERALAYLRDDTGFPCFGYYDLEDLLTGRPTGAPLHCVAVNADPGTGLCLGYAELFGVYRMIVCLSEAYDGPLVTQSYAVDPRSGESIPVAVKLKFSKQDLQDLYDYKMTSPEGITAAFAAIMPAEIERHFEVEKKRVIHDAVVFAMAHCGANPGDALTEDQVRIVARLASERMMPFIRQHLRRSSFQPPNSQAG